MGFVVNDVVKKQWDEKRFIVRKTGDGREVFIAACQEYETDAYNNVAVFFSTNQAYVLYDPNDDYLVNFHEMYDTLTEFEDNFPENVDEYCPIAFLNGKRDNEDIIEKLGLEPHMKDIFARVRDLAPYSDEEEVKF